MRFSHIVLSALHLVLSVVFIAAGVILFKVFNDPSLSLQASSFIAHEHAWIRAAALCLAGLGGIMIVLLYLLTKKRYYEVAIPASSCTVDLEVLKGYAKTFWSRAFLEPEKLKDMYLDDKGNFHLTAATFEKSAEKEIEKLQKIQKELTTLLKSKVGFDKTIFLTVMKES